MKSPVTNTAPSGAGEDDDDWTEFGESCLCDCREVEVCGDVNSVQQWQWTGHGKEPTFQTCFPTSLPSSSISTKSTLAEDENTKSSFWDTLCQHSATPTCVGQNDAILLRLKRAVLSQAKASTPLSTYPQLLDLPVDSELFDWQHKEREIDPVPTFVRPGKPESPVDINFDHSQAALGLAQLREEELKQMKWEMSDKFQHLSEVLVKELQTRDQLIHSLNVKNTFISSLLKVQSIRYHPSEEKISTAKYLHSVIPFHPPDDGDWQTDMLQQLTRILDAIAQNNETVPDLVSSYIQSEVLKE